MNRRLDGTIGLDYYRLVPAFGPRKQIGRAGSLEVVQQQLANLSGIASDDVYIEQQREHYNGLCHWEAIET